jgi:hypothetical protein
VSKVDKVPNYDTLDSKKTPCGCSPYGKSQKYHKRKVGGFFQIRTVVSLLNPCIFVAHPCTKNVPIMHLPNRYLAYAY